MSDVETLRQAAALMRERAEAFTRKASAKRGARRFLRVAHQLGTRQAVNDVKPHVFPPVVVEVDR